MFRKTALFCGIWLSFLLAARPALAVGDAVFVPWQERLGQLLTHPVVATVLLIVGIAGVVIEIATVGSFGGFGILGVLAFTAYFLGSAWNGSLTVLALILLAAGVALLIAEIFFVPGFGLTGALGIISVLAALVVASPTPAAALLELVLALLVSAGLIWASLKNRRTRDIWKRFLLSTRLDHAAGYDSADQALRELIGAAGVALTPLHPAGSAEIAGRRVDVVTRGEFLNAGTPLRVALVEGVRVVVEARPEAPSSAVADTPSDVPSDNPSEAPSDVPSEDPAALSAPPPGV